MARLRTCEPGSSARCGGRIARHGVFRLCPPIFQRHGWDRFLREITCGDDELAAYIQRLMALCITGLALHLLIFFYGSGRNGKGVLLDCLRRCLGRDLFAASLRPEDVEYHRGV